MNLIQSFQLSRCELESTSVPRPFLFCPLSLQFVISLSTKHIVLIKLPVSSVYSTLLDQVKVWLLILQNDETSAPLWARIPFMRSWGSSWIFHVFSSFSEFIFIRYIGAVALSMGLTNFPCESKKSKLLKTPCELGDKGPSDNCNVGVTRLDGRKWGGKEDFCIGVVQLSDIVLYIMPLIWLLF